MTGGLGGRDIKVITEGGEHARVSGIAWAANLSVVLREYLELALADGTGFRTLGEGLLDVTSNCRLVSRVWNFELQPGRSLKNDRAVVDLELNLVRTRDGSLLDVKRFYASKAISGKSESDLAASFSAAMMDAAAGMQDWIGPLAASCGE